MAEKPRGTPKRPFGKVGIDKEGTERFWKMAKGKKVKKG